MDTPAFDVMPATDDEVVDPIDPKAPFRERVGKRLLARFNARLRLGAPLRRVPDNLHRTAKQLSLGLELIDDFHSGRYRAAPWGSIALLTGALLYAVSPADVLPDALLGLGSMDDAIVLAIATRVVRRHLEAYCEFKGYAWDEYFASPTDKPTAPRETTPVTVGLADLPAN